MASDVQRVYDVQTVRDRFNLRLDSDLAEDVRRAASVQGVSITRFFEDALREHLGTGTGANEDIERRLSRLEELANL